MRRWFNLSSVAVDVCSVRLTRRIIWNVQKSFQSTGMSLIKELMEEMQHNLFMDARALRYKQVLRVTRIILLFEL